MIVSASAVIIVVIILTFHRKGRSKIWQKFVSDVNQLQMIILLHLLWFLTAPLQASETKPTPAVFHPFYIAVTEVTQNTRGSSLEISCKFFADDFEETLRKAYKTKLDINSPQEKTTLDKLIPDYISKHLALAADGKPLKLSYVGYEKDKESVYVYFEVPGIGTIKNLQATNSLLHDFKNEQINIMHVTVNGKRQSQKLEYPADRALFQFN